jgi:hypothetical protein
MNVALKEWSSIVAAISSGQQIVLLRKGGIVEADRGGFRATYREFLLFPTFEHQHARFLKSPVVPVPDDAAVDITTVCEVTDVLPAPREPEALLRNPDLYVWNEDFIRARYEYRPDLPLTLLLLRARRLVTPERILNRPSYAGCKSWVHLTEEIEIDGATPVLNDEEYARMQRQALSASGSLTIR